MKKSTVARIIVLNIIGFALVGCALFKSEPKTDPDIYLEQVNISLDADANNRSATAIDLLIIYDPSLLKVLMKMDAKTYYQASTQIKLDYPEMLDIWRWELTPGQAIQNYPIKLRSVAPNGAIVFARYYTPGPHRVRLGSSKTIHIRLKNMDFCVLEQGCLGGSALGANKDDPLSLALQERLKLGTLKQVDASAKVAQSKAAKVAKEAIKLSEITK